MKRRSVLSKITILSIFLSVLLTASPTMGFTDREIFIWVADALNIDDEYDMPAIQYVNKEMLGKVFRKNNEKSLKRWASEYGKEKATQLMDFYLNEVIGLYIPKTGDLYVGDFIEPCKKESIVAHELTHFFQHMKEGPVNPNSRDAANRHLYREMQASNIEKDFIEKFCKSAVSTR